MAESTLFHHFDHRESFAVVERDGDALDFDVALELIERNSRERGTHLVFSESGMVGGFLDGGKDQRSEALAGECRVNEDCTDLGGIGFRVEQFRFANCGAICAEEGFAFGPAAATCECWPCSSLRGLIGIAGGIGFCRG